ncbi:MFS-type transporter kojT [Exophiala dermatitidis]
MQSILQYYRLRNKVEAAYRREDRHYDTEKGVPELDKIIFKKRIIKKHSDPEASTGATPAEKFAQQNPLVQPSTENYSHSGLDQPCHGEPEEETGRTSEDRNRLDSGSTIVTNETHQTNRTGTSHDEQAGNTNEYDYSAKEDPKWLTVEFDDENDPENPRNWPRAKKWIATSILGLTWALVGWGSAISSAVAKEIQKEFGVSAVVESLATAIYLIALALGSWITAPYSETFGRNPLYIASLIFFMIFIMGHALAPNIGAQLAFQFLAGLAGSTPYTAFGGSLSDMWSPLERTYVFPLAAGLSFLGPFLAPMIGAFIGHSRSLSWRWTEWITLMMAGLNFICILLFVPETHAPRILKWKAEHLRYFTGDARYATAMEGSSHQGMLARMAGRIYRPMQLLTQEIMLICFTVYLTVVYIVLFTFLKGYDFIYAETYGLSSVEEGLCWLGLDVGFVAALAFVLPFIYRNYKAKCERAGGVRVEPEQRLWFAIIGAPWLPIALFFMAWTSYAKVSYWCSIVGSAVVGFSVQCIYASTYQYIIDAYEAQAASALVGVTFTSYAVSGGMIPVSVVMYKAIHVHWSLTLLGIISALLTPIPFVFYKFGAKARLKSQSAQG